MRARIVVGVLLVAAMAASLAGCNGADAILGVNKDDEVKMGREAGDEFEAKNGGRLTGPSEALVKSIGERVSAVAQPPEYPYDYRALDSKEVNAVAFPGGRVYVFRGLIEALGSDPDQLAWVIAHETSHVSQRHAVEKVERAMGYEAVISLALGRKSAAKYAEVVAGLMLQDYGRGNESEADRLGLKYAHDAGYDPTAAVPVLAKFREIQGRDPSKLEIMFASHPGNTDRENAVKDLLRKSGWRGRYFQP
jgi:beta-barrel assembly-enhancing protease